jgi:hypothetical protein
MATVARQRDVRRDVATGKSGERWGAGLAGSRVRRSCSRRRSRKEQRCPTVDQDVVRKRHGLGNHEKRDLRTCRETERELRMIVVGRAAG